MKLNKQQIKALEGLIYNMDELSNKPRRLFSSLAEFAAQFCDKEILQNILADIDEWEDYYYKRFTVNQLLNEAMRIAKDVKKQKCSHKDIGYYEDDAQRRAFKNGMEVSSKEILRKLNEHIINEFF